MKLSGIPKAILFDLDGTLIEFHHDYLFEEASRIIATIGHDPVERSELASCFQEFDFFRFVRGHKTEDFTKLFWHHFNWNGFPRALLLPGVAETLSKLRTSGFQLGVVTARCVEVETLTVDLEHTGILAHMEHVCVRPGEHVDWKDKRDTIRSACKALGVKPHETMMVGDIPPDITCGKEVGVGWTVAVKSGGISEEVLRRAKPDAIISDVTALPGMITLDPQQ